MINQNIWWGLDYWFWYRAWNSIGWSEFSDVLIAKAAMKPSAPPAPLIDWTDVSASRITVKLFESEDNGGDSTPLIYNLTVTKESTSTSSDHILTAMTFTVNPCNPGDYYLFSIKSKNSIGESSPSPWTRIACADFPLHPVSLEKVASETNQT